VSGVVHAPCGAHRRRTRQAYGWDIETIQTLRAAAGEDDGWERTQAGQFVGRSPRNDTVERAGGRERLAKLPLPVF
jgi:glutaconate CoA-transferase subunit A